MEFLRTPDLGSNPQWSLPSLTPSNHLRHAALPFPPSASAGQPLVKAPTPATAAASGYHASNTKRPAHQGINTNTQQLQQQHHKQQQQQQQQQQHAHHHHHAFGGSFPTAGSNSPSPTTVPPLDRASIKSSFQSLFSPTPNGALTPSLSGPPPSSSAAAAALPTSTPAHPHAHPLSSYPHPRSSPTGPVVGLTPFLHATGATPSLVPPTAAFFGDPRAAAAIAHPGEGSTAPTPGNGSGPAVALNSPFLQAAAKEAVRREFLNMPTYVAHEQMSMPLNMGMGLSSSGTGASAGATGAPSKAGNVGASPNPADVTGFASPQLSVSTSAGVKPTVQALPSVQQQQREESRGTKRSHDDLSEPGLPLVLHSPQNQQHQEQQKNSAVAQQGTGHSAGSYDDLTDVRAVPPSKQQKVDPSPSAQPNKHLQPSKGPSETEGSSNGDAKVPTAPSGDLSASHGQAQVQSQSQEATAVVPTQVTKTADAQPESQTQQLQEAQKPQQQQQQTQVPAFHPYFMSHPQHPHGGMVLMGPHGPVVMPPQPSVAGHPHQHPHAHHHHAHPHHAAAVAAAAAAGIPLQAMYPAHPQGMMFYPGAPHLMQPHPSMLMHPSSHPFVAAQAQAHAQAQAQAQAAQVQAAQVQAAQAQAAQVQAAQAQVQQVQQKQQQQQMHHQQQQQHGHEHQANSDMAHTHQQRRARSQTHSHSHSYSQTQSQTREQQRTVTATTSTTDASAAPHAVMVGHSVPEINSNDHHDGTTATTETNGNGDAQTLNGSASTSTTRLTSASNVTSAGMMVGDTNMHGHNIHGGGTTTSSGTSIDRIGVGGGGTGSSTTRMTGLVPVQGQPKAEKAAEKKARIEMEKQELIREFKKKTREAALVRFRQKRSERRFGKLIRYDCRKKLADARPRVKGRFVRIKADGGFEDDLDDGDSLDRRDGERAVVRGKDSDSQVVPDLISR